MGDYEWNKIGDLEEALDVSEEALKKSESENEGYRACFAKLKSTIEEIHERGRK